MRCCAVAVLPSLLLCKKGDDVLFAANSLLALLLNTSILGVGLPVASSLSNSLRVPPKFAPHFSIYRSCYRRCFLKKLEVKLNDFYNNPFITTNLVESLKDVSGYRPIIFPNKEETSVQRVNEENRVLEMDVNPENAGCCSRDNSCVLLTFPDLAGYE